MVADRIKRGTYSKDQIRDIYGLVKMFLESGHYRRADVVVKGLISIAPEFCFAWLASSVVAIALGDLEKARDHARKALKIQEDLAEAMIVLVVTSMSLSDYATAGTYLGELRDRIEDGLVSEPNMLRLFRMQMVRYSQEFDS